MFILNLFKGRMNRLTYLVGMILYYLVAYFVNLFFAPVIKSFLPGILQGISAGDIWSGSFTSFFAISIFVIIIFVPLFCSLLIRRLHDINASGWFTLLLFVPLVNIILPIFLFFKKGTEGSNQYGPLTRGGFSLMSI